MRFSRAKRRGRGPVDAEAVHFQPDAVMIETCAPVRLAVATISRVEASRIRWSNAFSRMRIFWLSIAIVFSRSPANATGASRTSSSTGVIVSVTACCCGTSPQASTSTQICLKRIVIVPRLYHRPTFRDNPHAPLPLPAPSSSTGILVYPENRRACAPSPTRHVPPILGYRRDIVLSSASAVALVPLASGRRRRLFRCSASLSRETKGILRAVRVPVEFAGPAHLLPS